jgi:SAM-dependent methyltransferase
VYRLYDALRRGVNARLVSWLLDHVSLEGGRLLEAGSGPAFATSLLNADPRVRIAVAVDLDLEAVREGRRRDPKLPAVVADVRYLPFPAGTFDLVWNSSTFEHLDGQDRVLDEMATMVRRRGQVFVGVPYRRGPLCFQREIARTALGLWLGPVWTREELSRALGRHGLQPIGMLTYFIRFFIGLLALKDRP